MSILSYLRQSLTWKELYDRICSEKAHLVHDVIPNTSELWEDIHDVRELKVFMNANTHFGLLCFNHKKQILLLHSIRRTNEPDMLIGTYGNSLNVNPIEISFPAEIFRSYKVTPATSQPTDNDASAPGNSQNDSTEPAGEPTPPPAFGTTKSFFLVPPAHVSHMLEHTSGVFDSAESLDNWLTTKILSTPPLSTDGYHHFDGFNDYWHHAQLWTQTIVQAPNLPFVHITMISDKNSTELFFLSHIPEEVMISTQVDLTTDPNNPPTFIDVINPPVAASIPTAPAVAIPKTTGLAGDKRSLNANPASQDLQFDSDPESEDDSPPETLNISNFLSKLISLNAPAPKKKQRRAKDKNTTAQKPSGPPPPGTTQPTTTTNPEQNPTDPGVIPADPNNPQDETDESHVSSPDPNSTLLSQLLQLMVMQQAQAQADQAKARTESRRLRLQAERERSEQALAFARTQEANARAHRELREAQERSNRETREASEQANRDLRDLLLLQASQLNASIIQATATRIERESNQGTDSKSNKKLWNKLPTAAQLAFTRGAATDETTEPSEPSEACIQIYGNTDKHSAQTVFVNKMASMKGKYHPGQLANLVWSGPLWEVPGEPETLTVFAIHPKSEAFTKHAKAAKMAAIKVDYDHHVDKEEINTLYQQDLNFPSEVYDFLKMLKGFSQILGILFGTESVLYTIVFNFYSHALDNDTEFADLAELHPNNLSKFLYGLDLAVQSTLLLLGDPDVAFGPSIFSGIRTELDKMKHDLAHRHSFNISFPQKFTADLREYLNRLKDKDKDKQVKGKDNPKAGQKGGAGGKAVKLAGDGLVNPNVNPVWKLPDNINYAAAFYAPEAKGNRPKYENKPFCLNYFVLGRCKVEGCQRLHIDPRNLSQTAEKDFNDYCKLQYDRCLKAAAIAPAKAL